MIQSQDVTFTCTGTEKSKVGGHEVHVAKLKPDVAIVNDGAVVSQIHVVTEKKEIFELGGKYVVTLLVTAKG